MPKAVHTSTTTPDASIIELSTARKEVEDALYEIGVIADIISKLASAGISGGASICPTSYSFLADLLDERYNMVSEFGVSRRVG